MANKLQMWLNRRHGAGEVVRDGTTPVGERQL